MKQATTLTSTLCGLALLATAFPALAADNPDTLVSEKEKTRREVTGVVSGAVIGGLVGGPIGAVVTAGFGAWVSDLTVAKKENTLIVQSLEAQQQELLALQAEYRALQARHVVALREADAARVRNVSMTEGTMTINPAALCCQDSELELHFKTGSALIEPLYNEKLMTFAAIVNKLPEAVIEITGHADRRGDSAANLALSQRRIQAVEERLRTLGVRNKAMQTSAYGESRPASDTDTLENNFFDRRVVVKVVTAGNGLLTQSID